MGIGKKKDKLMGFESLGEDEVDDIDSPGILVLEDEGANMMYKFFIFHFDEQKIY